MAEPMPKTVIVGGLSLSEIPNAQTLNVISDTATPFGHTSAEIKIMSLFGRKFAFLNRRGSGHIHYPHQIPELANFYKFMQLGLENVIQFTTVRSLNDLAPGTFMVFDEIFNNTSGRPNTFLKNVVVHLSGNDPFCPKLKKTAEHAIQNAGMPLAEDKTCACENGPELSNEIENQLYRTLDLSVVGMTQYPGSILGILASLCQVMIGLVTDRIDPEKYENDIMQILKKLLPMISQDTECEHCIQDPGIIVTQRNKWAKQELPILKLMFKRFRKQKRD